MELYPAVDVQGGRVARATANAADPLAALDRFARAGARWIHLVDLDRAFGRGDNRALARALLGAVPPQLRVQVGGGLSAEDVIDELFGWGAARVVIGAGAATDAPLVDRLLARHGPDRLAVGIDAREGRVTPRGGGGSRASDLSAVELARRVRAQGARTVVYTDVARDGLLAGPDVAGARALADVDGGLDVIASGGVASLDDLRAVRAAGLAGAIVGRALHEAKFTLEEALACVA
ncbi:MAG TPA: 1-(5-phosphoribosyl)-5-[(5-phosphoribosylamino)methylideneamino] imidazole-4-carboxamide isomerase [Gemmatimonadales bacterium]|nr:1-(5-phosphoribosyl)-5-[(5-phosphoribosylamino)methylideneamino] imidazole-4-carboxamide isomerase [Gemmatimonadales bacterium]